MELEPPSRRDPTGRRKSLWRWLREKLRPPRRLRFTREGRYFFFISLAIGFAAVNTGNNLLYLLLGMTLSLIVASGLLSERTLKNLVVTRHLPPELYAERAFLVGVELHNHKTRVPSYSVEVEDLADGQLLDKKCYFLKVPPRRSQHTSYRYAFPTRGLHRFEAVRLSTKFPFALFRKSRDAALPAEVVVYPALVDVSDLVAGARYGVGESPSGRAGHGEDFYAMRELREGEDPRSIHWKTSAKAGRMMVREREESSSRRIAIHLENVHLDPLDLRSLAEVERAIARAGSLATHFIDRGYRVRLSTRTALVAEGAGRGHLRHILRTLALLQIVDGTGAARVEPPRPGPGVRAIVITPSAPRTGDAQRGRAA